MIRIQVETVLPDDGGGIRLRVYDTDYSPAPCTIYDIPISSYYRHLMDENGGWGFQFWDFIMLSTAMLLDVPFDEFKTRYKVKLIVDGDEYADPYKDWSSSK